MGRATILVVEDEAAVRSMLKTVLGAQGYAVTTAVSAADAATRLAVGAFDIVLTDMRMETDTAGYDVVRAACARPDPPPVVILTAFPLLAQQWREAGAKAVLPKPARMAELLQLLGQLVADRRAPRH